MELYRVLSHGQRRIKENKQWTRQNAAWRIIKIECIQISQSSCPPVRSAVQLTDFYFQVKATSTTFFTV